MRAAAQLRGNASVSFLLVLSRLIDRMSEFVGRWVAWLVLAAVLISAVNAVVRKLFNFSSNAYLEIQWYLFAAVFLLAAGYTLLRQEHVKIDVILGRFSRRTQVKVEIFGLLAFLLAARFGRFARKADQRFLDFPLEPGEQLGRIGRTVERAGHVTGNELSHLDGDTKHCSPP